MVRLVCVSPDKVGEIWETAAPLVRSAIERGGVGAFEDVERDVLCNDAQLWVIWDGHGVIGAGVTHLYRESGICLISACGGSGFNKWAHLLGEIEAFAKSEGCTKTRIIGRKGWVRALPDYRLARVVLEKELR